MGSIIGMWDDGNCTMRHPYMCKTTTSTNNTDPPPSPPMCDESNHADFAQFNGACYKWINEPKSWSDAEDDCKQKGAHLVSIIDPVEQAYVFTELQSNKAWIGLSNMDVRNLYLIQLVLGIDNIYINLIYSISQFLLFSLRL